MFICNSADVFVGQWSIHGASVSCLVRAEGEPGVGDDAGDPAWGGSVVVPTWMSPAKLVGRTAELWFDGVEVRSGRVRASGPDAGVLPGSRTSPFTAAGAPATRSPFHTGVRPEDARPSVRRLRSGGTAHVWTFPAC
jgi:hypothetical protein